MSNRIYECLNLLLDESTDSQKVCPSRLYAISPKAYLKEFCTIKIGCSRQVGHTRAIKILLNENKFNALVICQNNDQLIRFKSDPIFHPCIYPRFSTFFAFSKILINNDENLFNMIIVDGASFLSEKKKEQIYNLYLNQMKKFNYIVFMQ